MNKIFEKKYNYSNNNSARKEFSNIFCSCLAKKINNTKAVAIKTLYSVFRAVFLLGENS